MADIQPAAPAWQPAANPWLIATAVMAATFMEVLDTSVANVSLAAYRRQSGRQLG